MNVTSYNTMENDRALGKSVTVVKCFNGLFKGKKNKGIEGCTT